MDRAFRMSSSLTLCLFVFINWKWYIYKRRTQNWGSRSLSASEGIWSWSGGDIRRAFSLFLGYVRERGHHEGFQGIRGVMVNPVVVQGVLTGRDLQKSTHRNTLGHYRPPGGSVYGHTQGWEYARLLPIYTQESGVASTKRAYYFFFILIFILFSRNTKKLIFELEFWVCERETPLVRIYLERPVPDGWEKNETYRTVWYEVVRTTCIRRPDPGKKNTLIFSEIRKMWIRISGLFS